MSQPSTRPAAILMPVSSRGKRIDGPRPYPGRVAHDRDELMILANDRRTRMQNDGRPRFDLTDEEIQRSTRTAMCLANASKSRADPRADARDPRHT